MANTFSLLGGSLLLIVGALWWVFHPWNVEPTPHINFTPDHTDSAA